MNKLDIKYQALKAQRIAVKLDVCLITLRREIESLKEEADKKEEANYTVDLLNGVEEIIQDQIEALFGITYDLQKTLKDKEQK